MSSELIKHVSDASFDADVLQSDKPVLVGVGVSNASQAVQVCEVADGVVIGSAIMRRVLEGGGPAAAAAFVTEVRTALDG